MATAKFYLDTRKSGGDKKKLVSLKIAINHRSGTSFIVLDIQLLPSQWDKATSRVIAHPQKDLLNRVAQSKMGAVNSILLGMSSLGQINKLTATELCKAIKAQLQPEDESEEKKPKEDPNTFLKWFDRFTERKKGRTNGIYDATRKRLVAWLGEEALGKVKFEDIKISWLEDFQDFLAETNTANSIAIHLRNIRAVVNYAIDNEVTTYYAFRRFKIKTEATRKRNFDINTLRRIFNHKCAEEWQQKYLDFFKLSFMLVGINVVDLCGLTKISQGRIEYIRAKTHRPYSIKVEKEAREIIERYAGNELLVNFCESYANYRHFYNNLCKGLNEIKEQLGLDELTTYWARHSWATIARKLKISKDTIALALGHGSHTVTDIYIEEDMAEVDEANRKVLDYVLYGGTASEEPAKKKRGRPRKSAAPEGARSEVA